MKSFFLLLAFLFSVGSRAAVKAADSYKTWATPADLTSVPPDYPRVDGGTDGENNPNDVQKKFTDSGWVSFYKWGKWLRQNATIQKQHGLGAKLFEIEDFLCGNSPRKSILIVTDSTDLVRLISGYLAAGADLTETDPAAKSCHKRVDFELIGQRLSGDRFVGTSETAWRKVAEASKGALLWHLPDVSEIISRGTHSGREDSGAETEFARLMASGQMKVLAGITPAYFAAISDDSRPGIRAFARSFGSTIVIDGMDRKELLSLATAYIQSLLLADAVKPEEVEYLVDKSQRYLMNFDTPLDASIAVINKLQTMAQRPDFAVAPALSVPTVKRAIGLVGNFPSWVINEKEKRARMKSLFQDIDEKLVGQNEALRAVVRNVQIGFVAQRPVPKPIASFLFAGPTGTGKTYLANQLSKRLYKRPAQTIDMTRYTTPYSAEAFADYVAEKLKANPYQVLVLEEIDKADVAALFKVYFLLDEGRMLTSRHKSISALGTIVIAATNTGEKTLTAFGPYRFETEQDKIDSAKLKANVNSELVRRYPLSFIPRFSATPLFYPFSDDEYGQLARVLVQEKTEGYLAKHWKFSFSETVYAYLKDRGASPILGARPMEQLASLIVEGAVTDYELGTDQELEDGRERNFQIEFLAGDHFVISERASPDLKITFEVDTSSVNFGELP